MKTRCLILGYFLFTLLVVTNHGEAASGRMRFGINWMSTDTSRAKNYLYETFDSLGFNTYHIGGSDWSAANSPIGWSKKSSGKVIPERGAFPPDSAHPYKPVDYYSAAERIIYQCKPRPAAGAPNASDTLTNYYFLRPRPGIGSAFPTTPPFTSWEILKGSVPFNDTIIWDSCEILNGPTYYNRMWRDPKGTHFKVAIQLHVDSVTTTDTTHLVDIWVRVHRYSQCGGATTDTLMYLYGVRWDSMTTTTDEVHFSPYFTFPFNLSEAVNNSGCDLLDLNLEVHAKRIRTIRLSWVALEDEWAHRLMAADLNTSDSGLVSLRNQVIDSIVADARYIRDSTNQDSTFMYAYVHDEAQVSEFESQARVIHILRDSVGIEGVTERGNYQMRRYAAQVGSPAVFWCGDFNCNSLFSASIDSGAEHGCVVAYDSLYHAGDTTYQGYTHATLSNIHSASAGYFPVVSGHRVTDSAYALDKTYFIDWRPTGTTITLPNTGGHTEPGSASYSFDVFDFAPYNLQLAIHYNYRSAMEASRLVYLDTTIKIFRPKEWWANPFITRDLQTYDPVTHGWYFNTELPPIGEQLSAISASVIASGGHGLIYWWGISAPSGPDSNYILDGFTDNWGKCDSDSTTYHGVKIPTMFKNHCDFAFRFSSWLRNSADSIYDKPWIGGFMRFDSLGASGLQMYHESIGRNPIVIPDSDVLTRPILNHWPAHVGDTSVHVVQDTLPDSLRLIQYGFFTDTSAAQKGQTCYYTCIVNFACDPRDVYCQQVATTDSTSVRRGERTLTSRLALDSTIGNYWKITVLDSTHASQIVAYDGTMKWHFNPGEGRIFRVAPFNDVTLGKSYCDYNNGRRAEFDGTYYHTCYYRNDSVFYKRSIAASPLYWGAEHYIAGNTSQPAYHPSLRRYYKFQLRSLNWETRC